jgi:hypothetical protein
MTFGLGLNQQMEFLHGNQKARSVPAIEVSAEPAQAMNYTPGPDGSARNKSSPNRSTNGLVGSNSQSCPAAMCGFRQHKSKL